MNLGHNHPRNRNKHKFQSWQNTVPKLHTARRNRRIYKATTDDKDYLQVVADARLCSCCAVHCEGWQSMETSGNCNFNWCQWGTVRFRKGRSMRKRKPKPRIDHTAERQYVGSFHCGLMVNTEGASGFGREESQIQDRSRPLSEGRRKTVHFGNLMDLCHLKDAERAKHLLFIQGASHAPGRERQGRRRIQSSIHRTRRTSFTDGSGKIVGHYLEASWYGWRSKWRSFSVHSGQDYQSSLIVTIARRRMSRDMDQDASTTRPEKLG